MTDIWDVRVHDDDLLAEIDMVTDMIITASESDVPLCHHTIDAVLQVPGRSAALAGRCRCYERAVTRRRAVGW